MSLFKRFQSDAEVRDHMLALSNFTCNISDLVESLGPENLPSKNPLVLPNQETKLENAKTYVRKREMHSVLNIWPFNAIKLIASEQLTMETVKYQLDHLLANRRVSRFTESFKTYVTLLKEEFKLLKEKNNLESSILNGREWWTWHNQPVITNDEIKLQTVCNDLNEVQQDIAEVVRYMEEILVDVHLDLAVKEVDGHQPSKLALWLF